jgi:hypothetical protein
VQKVSESLNNAYCGFALWPANGSVGDPVLQGVDYRVIFTEPSALQQAFAVYGNVLRMDNAGKVLNSKRAEMRAAQSIHQYVQKGYVPDPPLEVWEMGLPRHPGVKDIDPDAASR